MLLFEDDEHLIGGGYCLKKLVVFFLTINFLKF